MIHTCVLQQVAPITTPQARPPSVLANTAVNHVLHLPFQILSSPFHWLFLRPTLTFLLCFGPWPLRAEDRSGSYSRPLLSGALRPFPRARAARQERAGRARGRGLPPTAGGRSLQWELARSVRTSESAGRRDRRDRRRGRSRAEACEPASLRARSLQAGRRLVAAAEGA